MSGARDMTPDIIFSQIGSDHFLKFYAVLLLSPVRSRYCSLLSCQLTFSEYKPPLLKFSELGQLSYIVEQHVRCRHGRDHIIIGAILVNFMCRDDPPPPHTHTHTPSPHVELLSLPAPSRTSPVVRSWKLNHGQLTLTNIHIPPKRSRR